MIGTRYIQTVDIDADQRRTMLGAGWTWRDTHHKLYDRSISVPVTGSIPDAAVYRRTSLPLPPLPSSD
jgi:hypothetical protein